MHHQPTQLINLNELSQTKSASEIDNLYEKAASEALTFANEHKEEGVRVEIKNVKWQDVADWVINVSEGKVYKITDANTVDNGNLEQVNEEQ